VGRSGWHPLRRRGRRARCATGRSPAHGAPRHGRRAARTVFPTC